MRSIVPPLAAKLSIAASIKASTLVTSKAGSAAFNSRSVSTTSTVSTPSLSISMVVLILLTLGFLTGMASTPCGPREAYHSFRQERVHRGLSFAPPAATTATCQRFAQGLGHFRIPQSREALHATTCKTYLWYVLSDTSAAVGSERSSDDHHPQPHH